MARLSELKDLVAKARATAATATPTSARRAGQHKSSRAAIAEPVAAREPSRSEASATRSEASAIRGEARAIRGAASTRRTVAAGKHADGDIDLRAAFADVEPIRASRRIAHAPARPAPVPHQRIADAQDALAASKYGTEPAPRHWEVGQEHEAEQTFLRRGLPADVLSKLRRGHWTVQGELDLHRMTTVEARDSLADFLDAARARGARCVRVIHGKGLTSPGKEPVLKGKVRKWLAHWDDVLAYCEAPAHAGGGGAVLVLLRGK